MTIWFVLLVLCSYLLGSVPASYIAAKVFHGLDLRQNGTGQVGAGNLWRMTSWRLGLLVGVFDVCKGMVMVWAAASAGFSIYQQLTIGLAVIIGHNWPVFLRFNGGRGIGTTMAIVLILPFINDITPWITIICFVILAIGSLALRSSPLPVFVATTSLPITSACFQEAIPVNMAFLAVFLVMAVKRLTAPLPADSATISKSRLLVNRLFFDRDIKDRKAWMYRKSIKH